MTQKLILLAIITITCQLAVATTVTCPWDDPELIDWNDKRAWPTAVPVQDEDVVVKSGKKVVINGPLPRFSSIVVESGAVLVWGDVDGVVIRTMHILVYGEFHIGSEDCPFTKKADVMLYGKSNEAPEIGVFGAKFVGIEAGGVYEVHGKPKWSWTQLTATVAPSKPGDCGVLYDGDTEPFANEIAPGLHVMVWNMDGSVFDRAMFTFLKEGRSNLEIDRFSKYIEDLPDEKVVAMAVSDSIGYVNNASQNWDSVYSTMKTLGAKLITKLDVEEPYAFVAVTGDPTAFGENYMEKAGPTSTGLVATAVLPIGEYVFTVTSAIAPDAQTFRIVHRDLAYPKLNLLHDVSSWEPGDKIIVASTDYKWRQSEVKTIEKCDDCSAYQIRVNGEFEYTHFGEITYGIDQRAEVGLLSRNIRFQGILEDECYSNTDVEADLCEKFGKDTFGGHTKILKGAVAHIEGAEFYHMGQQGVLGSYPLHCHMCENAAGLYFRNNTIHDSNSRCITIHGTEHLLVSNNVCYLHFGHGFFLEDSAEQNNTIHRNLGIGSQFGTLIFSDRKATWCPFPSMCDILSTFWITHPNNIVTDNVAAGSDGHGIVFSFSDIPLGPSLEMMTRRGLFQNMSTRYIPVKEFTGNTMHSNQNAGLWFENMVAHGMDFNGLYYPENAKYSISHYSARDPPNEDGERKKVVFSELTFYKNERFNAWVRCGSIHITNSSFSDSQQGLVTSHIDDGSDCVVTNSIFYGETENKGEGYRFVYNEGKYQGKPTNEKPLQYFEKSAPRNQALYTISGLSVYQGPSYMDNLYFDKFKNDFFNDSWEATWGFRPVRPAAGISFHRSNHYTLKPRTGFFNIKFGYCDEEDNQNFLIHGNESSQNWIIRDGSLSATFRDYNGSITGVPNTQIVRNRPFFTGPECIFKPQWDSAICPYSYFTLSISGNNGLLGSGVITEWPMSIYRDDAPDDVFSLKGERGINFVLRTYKSYTILPNTTLAGSPTWIRIRGEWGLTDGEVVRIALCLPKATTQIRIEGKNPKIDFRNPPTFVDSLKELDADTTMRAFFWDPASGYIFFKMSNLDRSFKTLEEKCPESFCPEIIIKPQDTIGEQIKCTDRVPPFESGRADPPKVVQPPCSGQGSPEGLGAAVKQAPVAPEVKNIACVAPKKLSRSRAVEMRGCYKQGSKNDDFPSDYVYMLKSMTPQFCTDRCLRRGFPYAALNYGTYCRCGSAFGNSGSVAMSECGRPCSGDSSQICGGDARNYLIYTTGAPLSPPPKRCGPGNKGVLFEDTQTCVYLNDMEEEFPDAMRSCFKLGGSLAKIESEKKQKLVAGYLRGYLQDVWMGYTFVNGNWEHADGTVMTYTNWREGQGSSGKRRSTRLRSTYGWQWEECGDWDNNMALCDLPLTGVKELEPCGLDHIAWRRGSDGPCFAMINTEIKYEQAQFSCRLLGGQLAPAHSAAERYEILKFLGQFGDRLNYWVAGDPASSANALAYVYNKPHEPGEIKMTTEINALCLLDDVAEIQNCPSGWTAGPEGCYLNSGVAVNNYERVRSYCNSARSHVLSIGSQEENDFIVTNINLSSSSRVWLDLRYNSDVDNFSTFDGGVSSFSNWAYANPLERLSSGECAYLDKSSGQWRVRNCYSGTHLIVCEMPLIN